jgi:hypothetical protein
VLGAPTAADLAEMRDVSAPMRHCLRAHIAAGREPAQPLQPLAGRYPDLPPEAVGLLRQVCGPPGVLGCVCSMDVRLETGSQAHKTT